LVVLEFLICQTSCLRKRLLRPDYGLAFRQNHATTREFSDDCHSKLLSIQGDRGSFVRPARFCRILSAIQAGERHHRCFQTGAPISKNIYGQFLEHGGDIVNTGVWSELLVERKFYYPLRPVRPRLRR
jgi:hypothetical protein